MAKYIVTSPTGENFEVTASDSATEAEVMAYAQKNFGGDAAKPAASQGLERTPANYIKAGAEGFAQQTKDLLGGAVRGAGSIGSTLLAPQDALESWLARSFHGKELPPSNRGEAMTGALRELGADPSSLTFQGAKLGTEIAGTAGVGPAMAAAVPARVAAAAPGLVNALQSAGMTTGGRAPGAVNLLKDLALRSAAGGAVGGASTAMIDPEHAGTGAAIGAAMPPGLSAMGGAAKWIGGLFHSGKVKTAEDLAKALDLLTPADRQAAIAHLRAAPEMVPGSKPTLAQALRSPQASTLESIVSDSPGGAAIKERYVAQNAARKAAIEGVAATNPLGRASAIDDVGASVENWARPARAGHRARTSDIYQSVPQDEAMLYLPDLGATRDKYFGPGVFTDRAAVDKAVDTANKIGTMELPAVKAAVGEKETTLLQFVKSKGGIDRAKSTELSGEIQDLLDRGLGRFSYKGRGTSIDKMAEAAHEAGFLRSEDPAELVTALMDNPGATRAAGRDFMRATEAAMGDLPQAERVPAKVTLKQFEELRRSIGQEARAAGKAGNDTAAKALGDMRQALDDRINQVVAGDGAADEVLPIAWADKLSEARASKVAEVKQFGTGPQARIFKQGSQGEPVLQGGEVASAFWGNRPGLKEDVQSFRRLIDDKPELLGRFRSLVTTEGASTATRAGEGTLTSKYVQWFKGHLPGIKAAFDKDDVLVLARIASDINRAETAAAAGASRGSPTFRNAAHALDVGLLGSPVAQAGVGRIPIVGRFAAPAMNSAAEYFKRGQAERLSALLMDPDAAANALTRIGAGPQHNALMRLMQNPEAINLLYRATPAGLAANH